MTQAGTDLVKLGWTRRPPAERARDGTIGPAPLVVAQAWKSSQARLLERLVLRRLEHCRVRGEWLALQIDDAAEAVELTARAHSIDLALVEFRYARL
jgi:hypothetical protein